jgi:hypothetical protein
MRFAASEMPPLSATTIDGRVHSVFRRVVNLRLDDGELLTLYANQDNSEPPGAITIAVPADFDFSKHVALSAAISCRAGVLRIAGSGVSIDLRRARRRDPETVGPCRDGADTGFSATWHSAWQTLLATDGAGLVAALHGRRPAGSLDTALAGRSRQSVPQLLAAARAQDVDTAMSATAQLIGAGPGLTPSGDDFLAGFLVGARHTAQKKAEIAFLDALGRQLPTQYGNSGDIACIYLAHAAAGRAARPLIKLARLITNGDAARDTQAATVAAMQMGHSSGSDATFGILCGLTAWRRESTAQITVTPTEDTQ